MFRESRRNLKSGATIGPNSTYGDIDASKIQITIKNDTNSKPDKLKSLPKVRVTFNTDEDSRKVEITRSPNLDLTSIKQKAVFQSAEKQRKEQVRKELTERNARIKEKEQKLKTKFQATNLDSQKKIKQKELQNEALLQKHFQQLDLADREFAENQKQQLIQQRKKMSDVSSEIKKREESIRQRELAIEGFGNTQNEFMKNVELFTKCFQGIREEQRPQFANHNKMAIALMKNFEIITQKVQNSNSISKADLELGDKLLADITKVTKDIIAQCKVYEQQVKEMQDKEKEKEKEKEAQVSAKLEQIKKNQDAVDHSKAQIKPKIAISSSQGNFVNEVDFARYKLLMEVYDKFYLNEQQLLKTPNVGNYRIRLVKAINMPCNTISFKDAQFLMGKFDRLSSLLSGNSVQSGSDETVSVNEHPCAKDFAFFYMAKKFVVSFLFQFLSSKIKNNIFAEFG